jgi:hypothetical protein
MRLGLLLVGLCAGVSTAAELREIEAAPQPVSPVLANVDAPALQPSLNLTLAAPATLTPAVPALPPAAVLPAETVKSVEKVSASSSELNRRASPSETADGGRGAADRQFQLLTGERAATLADEEPTADDLKAARTAVIMRDPTLPRSVSSVVERELGLTAEDPLFESISQHGTQPRNAHTNAPQGDAYAPVNPVSVIAGLFHLREVNRQYYDSLKNPQTGVVATGVRGGVDAMVDALLEKGVLPPRSQGRNLRFLNGVYMDLPHHIAEARKFARVEVDRAEGRDRYPMYLAFRASNVHNPGTDYHGRIVGDGGSLGQVALDPVRPEDVVSIYVSKERLAQTVARIKGTALAHARVFPIDILPQH